MGKTPAAVNQRGGGGGFKMSNLLKKKRKNESKKNRIYWLFFGAFHPSVSEILGLELTFNP